MTVYLVITYYESGCFSCGGTICEEEIFAMFLDKSLAEEAAKKYNGTVKPMKVQESLDFTKVLVLENQALKV